MKLDGIGTTRYSYDGVSQILSEDGPWSDDTVTYGYTAMQRTSLSLRQPTGSWTNGFEYDSAKRLTNVTSEAGSFGYAYDPVRQMLPAAIALPNTSYISNVYDVNARLLSTVLNNSAGATLDAAMYGYNFGNQRATFTNVAGTDVAYTYDAIGQLKVATSSVGTENRGYAYDAAWNITDVTNNGMDNTFSVNNLNELVDGGQLTRFLYDGNGNLTNWWVDSRPRTHVTTNIYDDENRLVSVSIISNSVPLETSFEYDGLGRLREQLWWTNSTNGGSWILAGGIAYVYDGNRVIQERDLNNNPLVAYTRGRDLSGSFERAGGIGGLLARSDSFSSGNFTDHNFYHADGNGNVTYLVNGSQTLAASYRYDPFGNLTSSSGSLATNNTYQFSSKEYIPSVGMYHYPYRFYNPGLQRWLNRDPIGEVGGINLNGFAANSPVNAIDAFGWCGSHSWVYDAAHALGNWMMGNPGPGNPDSYAVLRTEELGSANFDFADLVGVTAQSIYDTANAAVAIITGFEAPAGDFAELGIGDALEQGLGDFEQLGFRDAEQDAGALANWETEGGNLGPAVSSDTGELVSRAQEIHSALDPIAQDMRTTAVLDTSGGRIVASGGRDLSPAQRLLLTPGETAARLPGEDAEVTALQHAAENGLTPQALGIYGGQAGTRVICPDCTAAIRASGGTLTSPTTAVWPRY